MIFLSYAREDAEIVAAIEERLIAARIPILKDPPQPESNPFWRNEIARHFEHAAAAMLIVWTQHAQASPWVDQEIRAFPRERIWFLAVHNTPRVIAGGSERTPRSATELLACTRRFATTSPLPAPITAESTWRRAGAFNAARQDFAQFRERTRRRDIQLTQIAPGQFTHSRAPELEFAPIAPDTFLSTTSICERLFTRFLDETRYARHRHHPIRTPAEVPVVSVSWYEAQACAEWLGGSLPTVAEWSAGTETAHDYATATGKLSPNLARYNESFAQGSPAPQRAHPPNPKGFFGLCGNTWDWCAPPCDPLGPMNLCPIRGGSWMDSPEFCALRTARYRNAAIDRDCTVGFRIVIHARQKGPRIYAPITRYGISSNDRRATPA